MKRLGKKMIGHHEDGKVFNVLADVFEFEDRIEYCYQFKGMSYSQIIEK